MTMPGVQTTIAFLTTSFRHKTGPTREKQEELLTPVTDWFVETTGLPLHVSTGLTQNHRIR
jgi:hypothetical protein